MDAQPKQLNSANTRGRPIEAKLLTQTTMGHNVEMVAKVSDRFKAACVGLCEK